MAEHKARCHTKWPDKNPRQQMKIRFKLKA